MVTVLSVFGVVIFAFLINVSAEPLFFRNSALVVLVDEEALWGFLEGL